MSISREITIETLKIELEECQLYAMKFNWIISELNEINLSFSVQMTSPIDHETFILEFIADNYPEWPPLIEFIHPETKERGINKAYPKNKKYSSFFHNRPCICNPCSRQAYGGYKNVHSDWILSSWKQNPKIGTLTKISAILLAVYTRISNKDVYDGRMA